MPEKVLITGGAGFIGSNAAAKVLQEGGSVVLLDNLSRNGTEENLGWVEDQGGDQTFIHADVRDADAVHNALKKHGDVSAVIHLAAQVAVTTSVTNPREDFEINALGTLNVLEAVRNNGIKPHVLFSSTNKVYGGMEDVATQEGETRWDYADLKQGVPETMPLDFHSPYGCSKGTADQYVRDYGRMYDIPTTVMRQSCIYGERQFGVEDQGWVAWFAIATAMEHSITIYGDGKQVRDVLHVSDLLNLYWAAMQHPDQSAGQIYNVGGGPNNSISIWQEFRPILEEYSGRTLDARYGPTRPGDQPVYISDIRKANRELGWLPQKAPGEGIGELYGWVTDNIDVIERVKANQQKTA